MSHGRLEQTDQLMKRRTFVRPEAQTDIREAARWYEDPKSLIWVHVGRDIDYTFCHFHMGIARLDLSCSCTPSIDVAVSHAFHKASLSEGGYMFHTSSLISPLGHSLEEQASVNPPPAILFLRGNA